MARLLVKKLLNYDLTNRYLKSIEKNSNTFMIMKNSLMIAFVIKSCIISKNIYFQEKKNLFKILRLFFQNCTHEISHLVGKDIN